MPRVISVRINTLPGKAAFDRTWNDSTIGYSSRPAMGRDYSRLVRTHLNKLGETIQQNAASRPFRKGLTEGI
ncbi:QueG-associated DUF1730 domain-containing protein [Salmonella enterica]|uniref:QueG-associated DUF1730 domain-containing protein n=1 Tax=Salmonella enterica TaxID=28901 RepID=UPI00398C58AE